MKPFITRTLVLALALATPLAARDLSSTERAALAGLPATDVATLRAGASEDVPPVSCAERVALQRAAAASVDLDALRAGDDQTMTILAVVGVVLLAVLVF